MPPRATSSQVCSSNSNDAYIPYGLLELICTLAASDNPVFATKSGPNTFSWTPDIAILNSWGFDTTSPNPVYFFWFEEGITGNNGPGGTGFTSDYFNITGLPSKSPPVVKPVSSPVAASAPPPSSAQQTTQEQSSSAAPAPVASTTSTSTTSTTTAPPATSSNSAVAPVKEVVPSKATSTSNPPMNTPTTTESSNTNSDEGSTAAPAVTDSSVAGSSSTAASEANSEQSDAKIPTSIDTSDKGSHTTSDGSETTSDGSQTTSDGSESTSEGSQSTNTPPSVSDSDRPSDSASVAAKPTKGGKPEEIPHGGDPGVANSAFSNYDKDGKIQGNSTDQDDGTSTTTSTSISGGAKAGIVIGVVVTLAAVVPLIIWLITRYRKRQEGKDVSDTSSEFEKAPITEFRGPFEDPPDPWLHTRESLQPDQMIGIATDRAPTLPMLNPLPPVVSPTPDGDWMQRAMNGTFTPPREAPAPIIAELSDESDHSIQEYMPELYGSSHSSNGSIQRSILVEADPGRWGPECGRPF